MNYAESSIILAQSYQAHETKNRLRLIQTMDIFHNTNAFSLFLSTESQNGLDEDFIYDISRSIEDATSIFEQLCKGRVTVLSLREITEDFLSAE